MGACAVSFTLLSITSRGDHLSLVVVASSTSLSEMLDKTADEVSRSSMESPPAYDTASGPSALPPAEGSSAHAQTYSVPKNIAHLFTSPSNAEDLTAPPSPRVLMIDTELKANGQIILSHDRRLEDRQSEHDQVWTTADL